MKHMTGNSELVAALAAYERARNHAATVAREQGNVHLANLIESNEELVTLAGLWAPPIVDIKK